MQNIFYNGWRHSLKCSTYNVSLCCPHCVVLISFGGSFSKVKRNRSLNSYTLNQFREYLEQKLNELWKLHDKHRKNFRLRLIVPKLMYVMLSYLVNYIPYSILVWTPITRVARRIYDKLRHKYFSERWREKNEIFEEIMNISIQIIRKMVRQFWK